MNYTYHKYIALFTTLLIASSSIWGQTKKDTLKRELLVISDYQIELEKEQVPQAEYYFEQPKITRLKPIPPQTKGDFIPPITLPLRPIVSNLAAQYISLGKPGYIHLGGGFAPSLRLLAGYNNLFKKKHLFCFNIEHSSLWNTSSLTNKQKSKVFQNKTNGDLGYHYYGEKGISSFILNGAINRHNYYASSPLIKAIPTVFISPLVSFSDFEQVLFNYQSYKQDKRDYSLQINYEHTGIKSSQWGDTKANKFNEHRLSGIFSFESRIKNAFRWGVKSEILANRSSYMHPKANKNINLSSFYLLVAGTPYIRFNTHLGSARLNVSAGAGLGFSPSANIGFFVYPKVKAKLSFSRYFELFTDIKGGLITASRHEWEERNPFIHPNEILLPERTLVDAELGFSSNFTHGISLLVSGGYTIAPQKLFLKPQIASSKNAHTLLPVTFTAIYDKVKYYTIKARIGYNKGEKVNFFALGQYRHFFLNQLSVAEGEPSFTLESGLSYSPIQKLKLAATVRFMSGIKYSITPNKSYTSRELRLNASYQLNSHWSIQGEINNPIFGNSEYPFAYRDYYPFAFNLGISFLF